MAARALADRRQHHALAVCGAAPRRTRRRPPARCRCRSIPAAAPGAAGHQRRTCAAPTPGYSGSTMTCAKCCGSNAGARSAVAFARRWRGASAKASKASLRSLLTRAPCSSAPLKYSCTPLTRPACRARMAPNRLGQASLLATGRQHGASEQYRYGQVEQQKRQRGGTVGQGVGAMQQQDGIAAPQSPRCGCARPFAASGVDACWRCPAAAAARRRSSPAAARPRAPAVRACGLRSRRPASARRRFAACQWCRQCRGPAGVG